MLRLLKNFTGKQCCFYLRHQFSTVPPKIRKWDLYVSVQMERLPVISRTFNEIEREYANHKQELEYEESHKSLFELREETERRSAEMIKEGLEQASIDTVRVTAQDLIDKWTADLKQCKLTKRKSVADTQNDLKSHFRKLEYPLTLLMEQKLGEKNVFLLPQGKVIDNETLGEAAQRVIRELCGEQMQFQLYGNAPCAIYKFKYPAVMRERLDAIGGKTFFYRAIYRSGKIDQTLNQNYQWLDKSELLDKVKEFHKYGTCLNKFII